MGKIKNLIFDLGGVLIDLDKEKCIESFRKIGYPQAAEMLSQYHPSGILQKIETGLISDDEFYRYIRENSSMNPSDKEIQDALNSFVTGLPLYKLQMLLDLRKRFKIYMLSNTSHPMFPVIVNTFFTQQGLTIDSYFDKLYLSYEMKVMKPDEKIYKDLLLDAGIRANESLFLDDSEDNIKAASKLGFETYLTKAHEDYRQIFDEL